MRRNLSAVSMMSVVALGLAAGGAAGVVNFESASFTSCAFAWTNGGSEFTYSIGACEPLIEPGAYQFADFGMAGGPSSSASVGIMHDSLVSSDRVRLWAMAYTDVADDLGGADCSAFSQATAIVIFTLDARSDVRVEAGLELSGSEAPWTFMSGVSIFSASTCAAVASVNGPDSSEFSARLDAGTYALIATAGVQRSIEGGAGGEGGVHEHNTTTFDVSVSARPVPPRRWLAADVNFEESFLGVEQE